MAGRAMRVFGCRPFLGTDQEVMLEVRFAERPRLEVVLEDLDGCERIKVKADITGKEGRYNLVTDCLTEWRRQFTAMRREPPTRFCR